MKTIGQEAALAALKRLKDDFRVEIASGYEHRAKSCDTCETFGACCLDEHFVNVHITELEAVAIVRALEALSPIKKQAVLLRVEDAIEAYELIAEGDTFSKTFACPLFEKESGCLVHTEGKPLACINHACYERKEDVPPDKILEAAEGKVERLNSRFYRRPTKWLPLPIAIRGRK
jgi:hypothetical protein